MAQQNRERDTCPGRRSLGAENEITEKMSRAAGKRSTEPCRRQTKIGPDTEAWSARLKTEQSSTRAATLLAAETKIQLTAGTGP
jgi:hypothetical protein